MYKALLYLGIAVSVLVSPRPGDAGLPSNGALNGRVIIVSMAKCCAPEAWPAAEQAVAAELRALGFVVVEARGRGVDERARRIELALLAEQLEAACALRIVRPVAGGGEVELWIEDRVTGKMLLRSLKVVDEPDGDPAKIAALRTVETLRASLMEIALPQAQAERSRISKPLLSLATDQLPRAAEPGPWALSLGAGGLGSPGGIGAAAAVALALQRSATTHLAAQLEVAATLIDRGFERADVRASFDLGALRLWGLYLGEPRGRLRWHVGLGGGAVVAWSRGSGGQSVIARKDAVLLSYLGARAGLSVAIGRLVQLSADGRGGLLLPEARLIVDEVPVAKFGRPLLEGWLAAAIAFL